MLLLLLLAACPRPAPATEPPPAAPAVRFGAVDLPQTEAERRAIRSGEPGFTAIARVGDAIGDGRFGMLIDARGQPIPDGDHPALCNSNDYNGLLQARGALLLVSHFECTPGAVYLTGLNQDAENRHLAPLWTAPVDFSGVRGGMLHCAGSPTPWGSHLASEEYEVDARTILDDGSSPDSLEGYNDMAAYFGDMEGVNPYDYGWLPEIAVEGPAGAARVHKRYAMGRLSHELGLVMPDGRTVYQTDDGAGGGFFLFVADREGDLSSGALYAARWEQGAVGSAGRGEAGIRWVPLGRAEEAQVARWLGEQRLGFSDLFDAAEPAEGGSCPATYRSIHTARGLECLRLRPGMALAASRLETRRYAALQGATTEFTKGEGLSWDPDRRVIYAAFSRVVGGMSAGSPQDVGGGDHIRLKPNRCGAIYGFELGDGVVRDSSGAPIDSAYAAVRARSVLAGVPAAYQGTALEGNRCDVEAVANPDNIAYLPGQGLLLIAEDSHNHVNNMLWAADLETGALTRVMTAPIGAELSGLHWFPDIDGAAYLTVTVQRPFRDLPGFSEEERRSYAGYIGPFPAR